MTIRGPLAMAAHLLMHGVVALRSLWRVWHPLMAHPVRLERTAFGFGAFPVQAEAGTGAARVALQAPHPPTAMRQAKRRPSGNQTMGRAAKRGPPPPPPPQPGRHIRRPRGLGEGDGPVRQQAI